MKSSALPWPLSCHSVFPPLSHSSLVSRSRSALPHTHPWLTNNRIQPPHQPTMVKVEIVDEKDQQQSSPYVSPSSSRTSSSVSLSSVDSDSPVDESFLDRISALKDIVPPTTRHSIVSKVSKTTSFVKRTTKFAGNVIWVVTTSALLIGLPLALILEDEAKVVAQENEMLAQQQGAQQVCNFSFFFIIFSPFFIRWPLAVPCTLPHPTRRNRVASRVLYHQAFEHSYDDTTPSCSSLECCHTHLLIHASHCSFALTRVLLLELNQSREK
jgi:mitochondrial import receptor subunit TOM22